jgi:hypothetical protein
MKPFELGDYGPAFAPLLETERRRPLNAGTPDKSVRAELERLSIDQAFARAPLADRDMASCCIAGLWLLHDFLDESHTISQSIDTPSGSYWHAIMHRREGDFSNSKYWYRRVGRHAALDAIGERLGRPYDPFAFVDRCEAVIRGKATDRDACLDIQQAEWELLFDHCYRAAVGDSR